MDWIDNVMLQAARAFTRMPERTYRLGRLDGGTIVLGARPQPESAEAFYAAIFAVIKDFGGEPTEVGASVDA